MKKGVWAVLALVFCIGSAGRLLLQVPKQEQVGLILQVKAERIDNTLLSGIPDIALLCDGTLAKAPVKVVAASVNPSVLTDARGRVFVSVLYSDVSLTLQCSGQNRKDKMYCEEEYMAIGMKKVFSSPSFYAEVRIVGLEIGASGA